MGERGGNSKGAYQEIRKSGLKRDVFIRVNSWFRSFDLFWKNKLVLSEVEWSQFDSERIDVNSYLKGNYGNNTVCGASTNKAKQSQFRGMANVKGQKEKW